MHAYGTVLGLVRGYLVYAGSRAEKMRPVVHRVSHMEIDIVTWPLDVAAAPSSLLQQVSEVASDAARSTVGEQAWVK